MARKRGGGGVPWVGILVLVAIALGVLVARTLAASQLPARSAVPATSAPTLTPRPTQAPAAAAPQRTATATAVPQHAAAPTAIAQQRTATAVPQHAATTPATAATATVATATTAATGTTATTAATPTTAATTAATATPVVAPQHAAAGAVALTFDAGADRGYAADMLDVLADERVPATFGITGNWARANPDLVRRIAAEGHMVINHTLDHRSFTGVSDNLGGLSASHRRQELEDADAIIAPLIGHSTRPWYRLPYGDGDAHVAADVAPAGYDRQIGWTVDSLGWRGATDQDIVTRCLKLAAPKAIFLLHVGRESRDGPALESVINGLKERGYSFVRVDAL
ncbi:MAG: polysaccharide deacetylase family protein [Chloroflexi bacterium]|nr:polysaccharide deacetylase family protein [Chloroflexota bacterium]